MNEARSFDELRRYWDEIARGEPAAPGDLDPDLAATIRRLHAIGDGPPPDPTYARQLRETIMHASTLPLPTPFPSPPNGVRAIAGGVSRSLPVAPGRRAPHRFGSLLATAALLALTLAAGFAAIGGFVRHPERLEKPNGMPAVVATPAARLPPGVTEDTVVFDQRLEEIPANASWAGVDRNTLAPGAGMTRGMLAIPAGVGPQLFRVEAGAVTLRADGPLTVTRAGTSTALPAAPDTTLTLGVGDVAFATSGVVSHWRNDGSVPATVLDAAIQVVGGAQIVEPGDTLAQPVDGLSVTPPPAPAQLTLRRMTLAPGASLPGAGAPGLKLVGVEAGRLEIPWVKPATPTVLSGSFSVGAGETFDVSTPYLFASELRNAGTEPATFFLLTITPLAPTATSTS